MEPLTTEQELTVDTANMNDTDEELLNEGKDATLDTDALRIKTGKKQDSSKCKDTEKFKFESRLNHGKVLANPTNVNEITKNKIHLRRFD